MAIGVFFILLALIVQIGFLVLARNVASTTVDAAVRRMSLEGTDGGVARARLLRDVQAVVPGAEDVMVQLTQDARQVRAEVSFRWIPPGPDFVPVTVSIDRSASLAIPP